MSKLDELILKAKDLAGVAGSKTQEVMELTKLHLQVTQLKSDIDANFHKLGEIVFELNKAGEQNEELIQMCVAEIESQQNELEQLTMQLNEAKNVVKCPQCMAANPKGALFCARCGASLNLENAESAVDSENSDATDGTDDTDAQDLLQL